MNDDELNAGLRVWGERMRAAVPAVPAMRLPEQPARRAVLVPLLAAAAVIGIVGGAGVVVTGLGRDEQVVPAGHPSLVPWADLPAVPEARPSPLPAPSTPAVRPCRVTDLSARYGGLEGATGSSMQWIVLSNVGPGACRLEGTLDRLTGVQRSVRRQIPLVQRPQLGNLVPAVLDPGTAGSVELTWYGRCDEQGMPKQPPYTRLVLTLLGGDLPVRTDLAGSGIAAGMDLGCLPRGAAVSVGPLGNPPPEPRYPHDPRADLTVAVDLPDAVEAGAVLHYVLRLTNPTSAPIRLEPCPAFVQSVASAKKANQLNCAAAHDVPAGGTESFAMELPVPSGSQPGPARLNWVFGFFDAQAARGLVVVRNAAYVAPSPAPVCNPDTPGVPCAKGMQVGVLYRYSAPVHCGLRSLFADGRRWAPDGGPVGGGSGPKGWGNPYDDGHVQLKKPDVLVYRSSTGMSVALHPDETAPPLCA